MVGRNRINAVWLGSCLLKPGSVPGDVLYHVSGNGAVGDFVSGVMGEREEEKCGHLAHVL